MNESEGVIMTDSEPYVEIALNSLKLARVILEEVISSEPQFKTTFAPYYSKSNSEVIIRMQDAAKLADVGPMASVAGVLADIMCERMVSEGSQLAVVENGGEIMIHSTVDVHIGLYSHTTQIKNKMGFLFQGGSKPLGIGTSSGTFGHATSLGNADTVTVFAPTAGVADAVATRLANSIILKNNTYSLQTALDIADSLKGIYGVFITCGDLVAKTGTIPEIIFSQ